MRAEMEAARLALEASKQETMDAFQARISALEAKLHAAQNDKERSALLAQLQLEFVSNLVFCVSTDCLDSFYGNGNVFRKKPTRRMTC